MEQITLQLSQDIFPSPIRDDEFSLANLSIDFTPEMFEKYQTFQEAISIRRNESGLQLQANIDDITLPEQMGKFLFLFIQNYLKI